MSELRDFIIGAWIFVAGIIILNFAFRLIVAVWLYATGALKPREDEE